MIPRYWNSPWLEFMSSWLLIGITKDIQTIEYFIYFYWNTSSFTHGHWIPSRRCPQSSLNFNMSEQLLTLQSVQKSYILNIEFNIFQKLIYYFHICMGHPVCTLIFKTYCRWFVQFCHESGSSRSPWALNYLKIFRILKIQLKVPVCNLRMKLK